MQLKNYLEDMVESILTELLNSKHNICKCTLCRNDMMAYALNRLPPKYVVSERGVLHSEIDIVRDAQLLVDVINFVNEAIDTVSSRVRPGHFHEENTEGIIPDKEETKSYFFNFPHLIGNVQLNDGPSDDIKIFLKNSSGELVSMFDPSWFNPYSTHDSTFGFYSFWPVALQSDADFPEEKQFNFQCVFSKEGFKEKVLPIELTLTSERRIYNSIQKNNIHRISSVVLVKN